MHACLKKDALHTTLPPVCPAATVASSYVDFSTNLSGPFSAIFVQNNGPYFPLPKYILTSPFQFFSNIFRHLATSPRDRSAAGANIWRLFTTRFLQHGANEGKEIRMRVHVCVSETNVSCTFPCTKMRKQSSADFYRYSKVCTTRIRSPLQYHTDTPNAACATYIYANSI